MTLGAYITDPTVGLFMVLLFPAALIIGVTVFIIVGVRKHRAHRALTDAAAADLVALAESIPANLWTFPPDFTVPIDGWGLWSTPLGEAEPTPAYNITFGRRPTDKRTIASFTFRDPRSSNRLSVTFHGIYLGVDLPTVRVHPQPTINMYGDTNVESIHFNDMYRVDTFDRDGAIGILTPLLIDYLIHLPADEQIGFRIERQWLYTYSHNIDIAYRVLDSILTHLQDNVHNVDPTTIHPFLTLGKLLPTLPSKAHTAGLI